MHTNLANYIVNIGKLALNGAVMTLLWDILMPRNQLLPSYQSLSSSNNQFYAKRNENSIFTFDKEILF